MKNNSAFICVKSIRDILSRQEPFEDCTFNLHHTDQAKLVQVLCGYIVAVDIRPDSPLFGTYYVQLLSFENQKICYIPRGFAHGYLTLEDHTLIQWCVDNNFCRDAAHSLKFNDPDIVGEDEIRRIPWPWNLSQIILSDKDNAGLSLQNLKDSYFFRAK